MSLIIDGYNLLHTTMPPVIAGLDEMTLCRLLAVSRWRGESVVVVCDGQPKPHAPASPVASVLLLYSGPGVSADDVIIQRIDADSTPRRLIVVSSDRQIQKAARRRRAQAWSSPRLVRELAKLADRLGGRLDGQWGDAMDAPIGEPGASSSEAGGTNRGRGTTQNAAGGMSDADVHRWARAFDLDPEQSLEELAAEVAADVAVGDTPLEGSLAEDTTGKGGAVAKATAEDAMAKSPRRADAAGDAGDEADPAARADAAPEGSRAPDADRGGDMPADDVRRWAEAFDLDPDQPVDPDEDPFA